MHEDTGVIMAIDSLESRSQTTNPSAVATVASVDLNKLEGMMDTMTRKLETLEIKLKQQEAQLHQTQPGRPRKEY